MGALPSPPPKGSVDRSIGAIGALKEKISGTKTANKGPLTDPGFDMDGILGHLILGANVLKAPT